MSELHFGDSVVIAPSPTTLPPGFDGNCNVPLPTIIPLLAWCTLRQATPVGPLGSAYLPVGSAGTPVGSGGPPGYGNVPGDL